MTYPRRAFLRLAAGAVALHALSAPRAGADLPGETGAHRRRLRARGRHRHHRAADGSMAVGAARPAVHHRKPRRRRRQHRHRGGRARAGRRLHAAACGSWDAINATLYDKLSYNFIRDIAPIASIGRVAECHGGAPVVSGQDRPGVHRLRQGQSRQGQHGVRRHRHVAHMAGELFKMHGRRRYAARALSRRRACADRSDRRPGAVIFRPMPSSIANIRAGKLRALAVTTANALGGAAGRADRRRIRAGLRGELAGRASARPRNTPADIVEGSTRRSTPASPIRR